MATGAAPGAGGGAVYLIAGATLEVSGTINASGEGVLALRRIPAATARAVVEAVAPAA